MVVNRDNWVKNRKKTIDITGQGIYNIGLNWREKELLNLRGWKDEEGKCSNDSCMSVGNGQYGFC
jgi:hypothetical protein